jgi:RNA polymerase sigma-70 factor, ECF subfamily
MDELQWLIAREIPHLHRYALALLRNTDAADDLVQLTSDTNWGFWL